MAYSPDAEDIENGDPPREATPRGVVDLAVSTGPALLLVDDSVKTLRSPNDVLSSGLVELLRLRHECHNGDPDAYWTYGAKLSARDLFVEAAEHYEAVARGDYDGCPLPAYDVCAAGEWTKAERFSRADAAFRRAVTARVPFADTAHFDALVRREELAKAMRLYPSIAAHTDPEHSPAATFTEIHE